VTWSRLSPDFLNYEDVGDALLEVDREMSGGRYQRLILNNFRWRQIGFVPVGPQLAPSGKSHALSARTLVPNHSQRFPRRSYHERWAISRGV
jgi:hypothetical protein